jgi:hypothetical protein
VFKAAGPESVPRLLFVTIRRRPSRRLNHGATASSLPLSGAGRSAQGVVFQRNAFLHAVILSKAKNGASGTSNMDGKAARVAASELGEELVQSITTKQLEMLTHAAMRQ